VKWAHEILKAKTNRDDISLEVDDRDSRRRRTVSTNDVDGCRRSTVTMLMSNDGDDGEQRRRLTNYDDGVDEQRRRLILMIVGHV